ncbi:MAG TPA: hypothetical protein VKE71_01675 [Candidatus Angelobacter sp.]|nr:hypothetical protein [Candidatus Angelobacter sp.]
MKQAVLILAALSGFALGQRTQQPQGQKLTVKGGQATVSNTPTPNDMYCSGFITTQAVPETSYIAGGWNSPDQAHFAGATDYVYVYGASAFKAGDRLHIVRRVKDPNHYELYKGERSAIASVGQPYFERGYVRVLEVQKNVAITVPELSCGDMVPGDLAIPLVEREKPVFRAVTLDRFALPNGKTTGRIVMANEHDSELGSGQKVYLNIGEDKGLKVGDYLRATRTYEYTYHDRDSGLSARAHDMEDNQKTPPKFPKDKLGELPRKTLGDMIVLHVHPRSATAMIITALEDIRVGDGVELMDVPAPEAAAPAPR